MIQTIQKTATEDVNSALRDLKSLVDKNILATSEYYRKSIDSYSKQLDLLAKNFELLNEEFEMLKTRYEEWKEQQP